MSVKEEKRFCYDDSCGKEIDVINDQFENQICNSCLDEIAGNVHEHILGRNITTTDVHDLFNFNFEVIEVKNG